MIPFTAWGIVFPVLRLLDFQLEPNSTPKASQRGEHYFGHIRTTLVIYLLDMRSQQTPSSLGLDIWSVEKWTSLVWTSKGDTIDSDSILKFGCEPIPTLKVSIGGENFPNHIITLVLSLANVGSQFSTVTNQGITIFGLWTNQGNPLLYIKTSW